MNHWLRPWAFASLLLASTATAGPGINLYYDDCGAGHPLTAATSACATNDGVALTLVGSAILPQVTRVGFCGAAVTCDVTVEGATLPDWWRMANPFSSDPACRTNAIDFAMDGTVSPGCPTLWDTHPNVSVAFAVHDFAAGPNTVRLLGASVLNSIDAYDLTGDGVTELGVFRFTIHQGQSTGSNACAGCAVRADITLREINLQTLADTQESIVRLTTPIRSNVVTWQGGLAAPDHTTPARNRSWGAIKALYR